jgi:hypothetical protein
VDVYNLMSIRCNGRPAVFFLFGVVPDHSKTEGGRVRTAPVGPPADFGATAQISQKRTRSGDGAVAINLHSCGAAGTPPRDRPARLRVPAL